ncbi:MAG: type II toxin-antitoxin system PemK/MazF family toxin [Phototrophicaceae bacterium]
MVTLVKGDVVVLPFPFSDLSTNKNRPALVISILEGSDIILCMITSQVNSSKYAIKLDDQDFESGSLKTRSFIRPERIFTADSNIVKYKIGNISKKKQADVSKTLVNLLT